MSTQKTSLFEQAARVFSGAPDPSTGNRLLSLCVRGDQPVSAVRQTPYQQCRCFVEGGRRVLLRTVSDPAWWPRQGGGSFVLLDLATGVASNPFPPGYDVVEVDDPSNRALLVNWAEPGAVALWDLASETILATLAVDDGWKYGGATLLAGGRRILVSHFQGNPHLQPARSHIHLLEEGGDSRVVVQSDRHYCNHLQGCPSDPALFAYDRWEAPARDVDQVIHVARLDGSLDEPARLDANAPRPASMFGVRDHYLWTPDGKRIVSYLNPDPYDGLLPIVNGRRQSEETFNHFEFNWILSALDWRTGEDRAAPYPPGRWGCHPAVTPDSRRIISAGAPGFDYLYAVDLEGLRHGWNETIICAYPRIISDGHNNEPFPFPFVLPDGSGVLFNAGWPGPEHGLYLAELRP
jgi:hypothetical protein